MSVKSQFTPKQILEAARRAEAESNFAYAQQFYRHLAEHHAETPESLLAREALNRLARSGILLAPPAPPQHVEPQTFAQPPAPLAVNGQAGGRVIPHPAIERPRATPALSATPALNPQQASHAAQRHAPTHEPAPPHPSRHARTHEPVVRHYRLGRILALMLGFGGWIALVAAVAALVAPALVVVGAIKTMPPFLPAVSMTVSFSTLIAGVMMVLISQIARATFDAADAARHAAHIRD